VTSVTVVTFRIRAGVVWLKGRGEDTRFALKVQTIFPSMMVEGKEDGEAEFYEVCRDEANLHK
jgi:hypothetical protein